MKISGMQLPEKNRLEWLVFGLSLLLVLATVGYLVREALTTERTPPEVLVTLGAPRPGGGGFMVPVLASNRGGRAAEEVQVSVTLELPGSSHESVLSIPFLPRESERLGWVAFRVDPRAGLLRVSGVAFQSP